MTTATDTLRIGINTLFLIPGEVGGSETYLRETLAALRSCPGVRLHLFTNTENHASFADAAPTHPELQLHPIRCRASSRPERIIKEQMLLPQAVARAGIDLLWNPGYTAPLHCAVPMVTSILDMQYKHYPEDLSGLARLVTDRLVRAAARRSRAIMTISDFSRQDILRFTTARPERVHVTHLAVDPAFAPAASALQPELPAPIRPPFILSVANSYPHKNLPALVEAFGRLAPEAPDHQLVLLGLPRRGEEALQRAIQALPGQIRSRVIRPERQSRDALVVLYQAADLFVFPSLYEGFGLPVLEAMMARTRVVTTSCASIPEIAGGHAILASEPTASGLAAALRHAYGETDSERAAACSAAASWAATFTWQQTAARTLEIFKAVVHPSA